MSKPKKPKNKALGWSVFVFCVIVMITSGFIALLGGAESWIWIICMALWCVAAVTTAMYFDLELDAFWFWP